MIPRQNYSQKSQPRGFGAHTIRKAFAAKVWKHPVPGQIEALETQVGARAVYVVGRGDESFDACLASYRGRISLNCAVQEFVAVLKKPETRIEVVGNPVAIGLQIAIWPTVIEWAARDDLRNVFHLAFPFLAAVRQWSGRVWIGVHRPVVTALSSGIERVSGAG